MTSSQITKSHSNDRTLMTTNISLDNVHYEYYKLIIGIMMTVNLRFYHSNYPPYNLITAGVACESTILSQ